MQSNGMTVKFGTNVNQLKRGFGVKIKFLM